MDKELKPIYWAGTSKNELLAFPDPAKQDAGYQLHRLQSGRVPQDWKPLKDLGKSITGVYEVRIWDSDATFRLAYVTKFGGFVTVLHCWQKETRTTSKADKHVIVSRYAEAKERIR